MASDGGVTAKLASAKAALAGASGSNVSTRSGHPFEAQHEYSKAPYSIVHKIRDAVSSAAKPETDSMKEAHETGVAIKSKMENAKEAGLL